VWWSASFARREAGAGPPAATGWRRPSLFRPQASFLSELLAAVLVPLDPSPGELHAVDREWGRYLLGRPGVHHPRTDLSSILERLGFHAHVDKDVVLLNCPCPFVAPDHPELVCELAAGVLDGVAEVSDGGWRVGWRRHNPVRRSCRLSLSRGATSA
jgi:hypothetical protein